MGPYSRVGYFWGSGVIEGLERGVLMGWVREGGIGRDEQDHGLDDGPARVLAEGFLGMRMWGGYWMWVMDG